MNGPRGMTLMELLVGLSVAGIVVGGAVQLGNRHFFTYHGLHDHIGVSWDRAEAGVAAQKIAHLLARADRVNVLNEDPAHLQFRVFLPQADAPPICPVGSCTTPGAAPAACCFDIAENYQWNELRYDGASRKMIWYPGYVTPPCSRALAMGGHLTTVAFAYRDTAAPPPPGGDADAGTFAAAPADPNMLAYRFQWDNGEGMTRDFNGMVALQGIPDSNVQAGAAGPGDSGLGLDANNVAPPGATCP